MPTRWNGQVLRLTVFASLALEFSRLGSVWREIVGEPPELDESREREGARRQAGPMGENLSLEFRARGSRLDWLVTSPESEGDFGPYEAHLERLIELVPPWVESEGIVAQRLALGAILLLPVPDIRTGYQQILEFVPSLRFDLSGELSDLLFQINRPRPSAIVNHRINRLMKWSVLRQQRMTLMPQGDTIVPVVENEAFACRLETDINTAPSADARFESGAIGAIFKEFAAMAGEIANRGELA